MIIYALHTDDDYLYGIHCAYEFSNPYHEGYWGIEDIEEYSLSKFQVDTQVLQVLAMSKFTDCDRVKQYYNLNETLKTHIIFTDGYEAMYFLRQHGKLLDENCQLWDTNWNTV